MAVMSASHLAGLVQDWMRRRRAIAGSSAIEITETTDLVAQGWLDSVGFVELMLFLEKESGRKIDLSTVEEFTTIAGLWGALAAANGEKPANAA
jgi:acyl carrier protein